MSELDAQPSTAWGPLRYEVLFAPSGLPRLYPYRRVDAERGGAC